MVDNGDSPSNFGTSDNNLFFSVFVYHSKDVAVLITAFLIHLVHMSALAGQGAPYRLAPSLA